VTDKNPSLAIHISVYDSSR